MTYLVLARKYRPQTFDEVIGQAHVTQTLKHAIQGGRVAHALLFSGPRGTGKTTVARILAKAMNCEKGPSPTPCNACRSCKDITACRGVDVFEIDGASNNSVDQVRELRDNSRYMPAHSRFKIYIIDEVHMLSIAAFNALLKTLEEPPAHVMFLFATTEVQKIPITILSRCQRHDLHRIDLAAIVQQMETLCREEGVSLSPGNLWSIARESGGSMRDALSLLDQVLASSDGEVDDAAVSQLLGSMDRQVLFDLSAAIFGKDLSGALSVIDTVYRSGQDLKRFYADLLMHVRHLMLIKMKARADSLADLSPEEIDIMTRQLEGVPVTFVEQVFSLLFDAEARVRQSGHPRLAIEMVCFKVHQMTPVLPIDQLIERMDTLLRAAPAGGGQTGIVESQSPYGHVEEPLPVDRSRREEPAVDGHCGDRDDTGAVDTHDRGAGAEDDDWSRFIAVLRETKPSIAATLARAQLASTSPEEFSVVMRDAEYSMNLVKKNLSLVESLCRQHAHRGLRIDFATDAAEEGPAAAAKQQADDIRRELLNHPLVADAVDIFNGKIEEIKIR